MKKELDIQEDLEVLDDDIANTDDDSNEESPETLEDINERLQKELSDEKDKYLRLFAEFENYKKRTLRERMELFKTAGSEVLQALIPVLDDFGRGLKEIKTTSKEDSLIEGVELIYNKLVDTVTKKGLEKMEVFKGDDFDPEIHEAITQIPAPEESLKGKIVDVIEEGYMVKDKIIRYTKVVTGK